MKLLLNMLLFIPFLSAAQITDSAQRILKVEGAVNMRDLGGYSTIDGKHVKWNMLYRSADISKLTDADLDTLKKRKISYVVDLR